MSINEKTQYIEIGTSINSDNTLANSLSLPAPHNLPSSNQFMADAGRGANGAMLLQQVGRTQYKGEIKWEFLKNKTWWKINRWFDFYGYVFYMKYFSHTEGKIKIHRFYRGNITNATPSSTTEVLQGVTVPKYYHDCGFSVIDMGDSDVITIQELGVL